MYTACNTGTNVEVFSVEVITSTRMPGMHAPVGEILSEVGNIHDTFAVAIKKDGKG